VFTDVNVFFSCGMQSKFETHCSRKTWDVGGKEGIDLKDIFEENKCES
jgi:hypothetical protein